MFLQTDPVGYGEELNLYTYTRDDPLNRLDPGGEDSITVRFRDQVIHYPADAPFGLAGQPIPQGISGGHSGIVLINEDNGLTRYREFGRYGGDATVRSLRVPNLQFINGVPTPSSVGALLSRIVEIGEGEPRSGDRGIRITLDLGTDFQRMVDYVAQIQELDPEWSWPAGMNCHNFCSGATNAGGNNGPRLTLILTRENREGVAAAIVRFYELNGEKDDERPPTGTRIPPRRPR